jgi:hypothetical protein
MCQPIAIHIFAPCAATFLTLFGPALPSRAVAGVTSPRDNLILFFALAHNLTQTRNTTPKFLILSPSSLPTMASDNAIPEAVPGANTYGSDITVSEAIPRTITHKSDDAISELIACESIANSHEIFPFEKLPPEIRDLIYDLVFHEREEQIADWHYNIRTTSPDMRLLNRQVKREYDQRPPINNFIEVSEIMNCPLLEGPSRLPALLAARMTTLHFNAITCVDRPEHGPGCMERKHLAQMELRNGYESGLDKLVNDLPLLKKVTMSVSCGNLSCAMALQSYTEETWPSFPDLSHIALLRSTLRAHSNAFFEGRETMATWTPAHG